MRTRAGYGGDPARVTWGFDVTPVRAGGFAIYLGFTGRSDSRSVPGEPAAAPARRTAQPRGTGKRAMHKNAEQHADRRRRAWRQCLVLLWLAMLVLLALAAAVVVVAAYRGGAAGG